MLCVQERYEVAHAPIIDFDAKRSSWSSFDEAKRTRHDCPEPLEGKLTVDNPASMVCPAARRFEAVAFVLVCSTGYKHDTIKRASGVRALPASIHFGGAPTAARGTLGTSSGAQGQGTRRGEEAPGVHPHIRTHAVSIYPHMHKRAHAEALREQTHQRAAQALRPRGEYAQMCDRMQANSQRVAHT
jgi:hypothetical protein